MIPLKFEVIFNYDLRLRSGHLMCPGGVTFGVIGSSFFGNVSNCWLNSYGKFGGATRRRFFAICEKPEGGGRISAPGRAQVKRYGRKISLDMTLGISSQVKGHSRYELNIFREDVKLFKSWVHQFSWRSANPFASYSRKTRGGCN